MRSIVFVDDHGIVLDTLERLAKTLARQSEIEWDIKAIADPIQALDCISANPPTYLVTDLEMPRMDGLTLAARFRETGDSAATTHIVISSSTEVSLEQARQAGIDQVIQKPLPLSVIVGMVNGGR